MVKKKNKIKIKNNLAKHKNKMKGKDKATALFLGRSPPILLKKDRTQKRLRFAQTASLLAKHKNKVKGKSKATALFLGRFQPIHLGHLHIIKGLSLKHEQLIIIIGTRQKHGEKNPFNYSDRKKMLNIVVQKMGIKNCKIIGLPDNKSNDIWFSNLKRNVPKNSIMYSGNKEMLTLFPKYNVPIRKIGLYKKISATKIRAMILKNDANWKLMVDSNVTKYIENNELINKINKHKE